MSKRNNKNLIVVICLLVTLLLLSSCSLFGIPSGSTATCAVTFVYNNGSPDKVVTVKQGNTVNEPISPSKTNCTFAGWYTDDTLVFQYDFSRPINDNLTLYAKYNVNYAALTNQITATTMKANVTVITKSYDTFLGITTSYSTKSGSGIIYSLKNGNYYLLTNNHVTIKDSSYDKVEYTIEDYKSNSYKATLVYQSPNYDLAVLYFKKNETLQIVELANTNPLRGTELAALGQPKSQSNALTYGTLSMYTTVTLTNTTAASSNVKFQVIVHTCPINNGSSGGALLDTDLKLVGINYASGTSSSGEFIQGYAIPIEKVREFLRLYAGYNG